VRNAGGMFCLRSCGSCGGAGWGVRSLAVQHEAAVPRQSSSCARALVQGFQLLGLPSPCLPVVLVEHVLGAGSRLKEGRRVNPAAVVRL